ncbi:MAG TPA: hypothetical protein PLN21_08455 [Gemmatales bacterium]|nr:hypothetical protein [Gemmatales bacterium]
MLSPKNSSYWPVTGHSFDENDRDHPDRIIDGNLHGGFLIIVGDLISGTMIGIIITMLLCVVIGTTINGFSGLCAGLVTGGMAVLYGHIVSHSSLGIGCTLVLCTFIGSVIGWIVSQHEKDKSNLVDANGPNSTLYEAFVFHQDSQSR